MKSKWDTSEAECQGWKSPFLGVRIPRCYFQFWKQASYFFSRPWAPGSQKLCLILLFKCFVSLFIYFFLIASSRSVKYMLTPLSYVSSFIMFSTCFFCVLFLVIVPSLDSSLIVFTSAKYTYWTYLQRFSYHIRHFIFYFFFKPAILKIWTIFCPCLKKSIFSFISLRVYTFLFLSSVGLFLLC